METKYLIRLVLANGTRMMMPSSVKTRTEAWSHALTLMDALKATNAEIWRAYDYTLVMEIESK